MQMMLWNIKEIQIMTDIENTPVASKTPKPRVRRVGAITMGLTLIVAGISIVS